MEGPVRVNDSQWSYHFQSSPPPPKRLWMNLEIQTKSTLGIKVFDTLSPLRTFKNLFNFPVTLARQVSTIRSEHVSAKHSLLWCANYWRMTVDGASLKRYAQPSHQDAVGLTDPCHYHHLFHCSCLGSQLSGSFSSLHKVKLQWGLWLSDLFLYIILPLKAWMK